MPCGRVGAFCQMPKHRAVKAEPTNAKPKARRPLRFHQSEAERAMRAVRNMGLPICSLNVAPDGSISIGTVGGEPDQQTESRRWDERVADVKDKKRTA